MIRFYKMLATVVSICTCCILNDVQAQTAERRNAYDSLLVGDRITPAVSSVMMPKSYTEVILSNALLTTNTYFTVDHVSLSMNQRYTYFINTLQVTHGIAKSGRFNVGLDFSYRTGRQDIEARSSPMKVFGNDSKGLIQYERAITSIGIRARYLPFAKPNFVVQQTFYIPMSAGSNQSIFLGDNRYALNTQLLYNYLISRKMFLFVQADLLVRFRDARANADFTNPINVFASYLMTKHIFPFALIGMTNSWDYNFDHTRQYFTYGVGMQYQFNTMFTVNLFYSNVFSGENSNQWKTFNPGIRKVL
ncbi:MAG TPA: hypothetical protein VIM75_06695 [Ohtaekwangia sp.]|uniref:hypothetical protein n=1 Tax=Ohtaekwangia sp. TaxID=2066019 RepID=UPI002F94B878